MILKLILMLIMTLKTQFLPVGCINWTPEFKKVFKFQYDRGTDFKQDLGEYVGNNCCIPTSGSCFRKCINYLTGNDYTKKIRNFFRDEKDGGWVMKTARIQPFCENHNNILSVQVVLTVKRKPLEVLLKEK